MFSARPSQKSPTTFGSARWADRTAVSEAGLFADRGIMLGESHGHYLRHAG